MSKKFTLAEMFENQPEKLKEAIRLIDEQYVLDPVSRESLEVVLDELLKDESLLKICRVYMDSKYPDSVHSSESEHTNEDILKLGDIDDDDDKGERANGVAEDDCKISEIDSRTKKSRFERVLNVVLKGSNKPKKNAGSEFCDAVTESFNIDDSNCSGYQLLCSIDKSPAEFPVHGETEEIVPEHDQYVHVDLVLPDIVEKSDLRVEVTTLRGKEVLNGWFDKVNIPLCRDGNHLHLKPTLIMDLFGQDYKLNKDEQDSLVMILYKDAEKIYSRKIPIKGPWPSPVNSYEACTIQITDDQDTSKQMKVINEQVGWNNFKARMAEIVSRCEVAKLRKDAGLTVNFLRLHTVIIGNPGTGKSSCIPFMASLYKSLGLLDTEGIWTTRVSKIASSSVNGEYENMLSAIENAKGGTLVFENAHELYRIEKNNNYDTEQRIIRALIDGLENVKKYPKWMLVLVGEPEGLEAVLAANPDLKKNLTAPICMDDFKPEELGRIARICCNGRNLRLTKEANSKLEMYILHKYNHRGFGFQNAWMVQELFDEHIIPTMCRRLQTTMHPTKEQLETVEAADIPMMSGAFGSASMAELDELVGLGRIKTKVMDYLNAVKLAGRRMELGLLTNMPRLHMTFLGNPGTGKTTVAEIIGKVFASWGILSGGRVIRTEKSQMVGQYIGETEFKMRNLLERAHGNILFIDEAYQLVEGGEKDYGRIVMNSLLTELGKENLDMVVILAGYTAPMKQLLESNEGIESRFPNVFNFEDYTTDELVEIGKLMIRKQGFTLTSGAEANMRAIMEEEAEKPSPRFGNGRFVSNLLQNEILATLGARTAKIVNPTKKDLSTILPEDVVIGKAQKDVVFDDVAIDAALARLDQLAGLGGVKKAIHNFVKAARYLHDIGEPYVGKGLLSWRFIGRSGTGKSTVAEIMASILKGMRLIANHHITEIKGDRIIGVSEPDCDAVLKDAVKRSCNGLIFIDVDEPKFSDDRVTYGRNIEQIRLKVKEMTVEVGGECALVVAELNAPNADVAEQLSDSGVYEFDHTLIFKDFSHDELFDVLCHCLGKFKISFASEAEKHIREYLGTMKSSIDANARTMKLMARTIHQQVILREAGLPERPAAHQVLLEDVESFKWDCRKGRIGF